MAYTTIDDPSAHFQIALYTGTGSALSATNDGNSDLQPDLVWIKERNAAGYNHYIGDSSRGSTKQLFANLTSADATSSAFVTSFNSDGFSIGDNANINEDGSSTYVAWQWKANVGTRTTNTESGDNPAGGYQANTTAGFSIVDYVGTGAAGTMAHGLGVAPKFIIVKSRDDAYSWYVMHNGGSTATRTMDATDKMELESDGGAVDNPQYWNDTAPTSTVFTVGAFTGTNKNDSNFIAYVWAPIQGFSKFGSYTGNGNADGPFIYTGFRPAWIMVKRSELGSSGDGSWRIIDSKRNSYNGQFATLQADANAAEYTADDDFGNTDILSNGFKLRQNYSQVNASGGGYIYMAFAENPFVTSGGTPCTAR